MCVLPSVVSIVISFLVMAQPGKAPSADEQRLFDEGMRAYQAGDARAAEKAWKAGYQLGRDPAFLVRIGEAQEKAGAPLDAAESYRHYLREAGDAADRAEIDQRIARLAGGPGATPAPADDRDDDRDVPGAFGDAPAPPAATAPAPAAATPPAGAQPP